MHQVGQEFDPSARVVYVDNDPMVSVHGQALLGDGTNSAFVTADLREPADILSDDMVGQLIDLNRPVGFCSFTASRAAPRSRPAVAPPSQGYAPLPAGPARRAEHR